MWDYTEDVLAVPRGPAPAREVTVQPGLVVEDRATGFTGAIVALEAGCVRLEDGRGRQRLFRLDPRAFAIDGRTVTLVRPAQRPEATPRTTASGSRAIESSPRVARASRIWVEGLHDADLVERVWGDDLRVEGVVVEVLDGADGLADAVHRFAPGPDRRLGVLLDHLVAGSKESRLAAEVAHPDVLVTGHPYVDVWAAVRPELLGLDDWPDVPRDQDWKTGVCAALGVSDPSTFWPQLLARVSTWRDLRRPLIGAVEELIDFVAPPPL